MSDSRLACVRILVAGLASVLALPATAAPPSVGGDPRVDPADFEVTEFATGLDFPVSMQELEDGSLLVGLALPDGTSGSFLNSIGELRRFVDADSDGVADGPGSALYGGLPGAVTSLRIVDDLAVVATGVIGTWSLFLLRRGAAPADAYTLLGSVDFSYALPWSHLTFGTAVRAVPGLPGHVDVFFNLGSRDDAIASVDPIPYSGLVSGSADADSMYRIRIDDSGPVPSVSAPVKLAAGVRNGFGSAVHPLTGDLYFSENGYRDSGDPSLVLMSDELNVIPAADLGGAVEDFGFPGNYVDYTTGGEVGSGGVDPAVAFRPLAGGEESLGPAEISFAPLFFPPGLRSGLFVGFQGSLDVGLANTGNPVVYVDLATGEYFHFIGADDPNVGHPDGLLATDDSLFVADFATSPGFSAFGTGAIYKIRSLVPVEVPALAPWAAGLAAAGLLGLGAAWLARGRGVAQASTPSGIS